MNANELANFLDKNAGEGETPIRQAVTMLRQQQAEIEALKTKLGCDPAYFDMPAKKLTDEEIDEVYAEYRTKGYKTLARAILRKAQENDIL